MVDNKTTSSKKTLSWVFGILLALGGFGGIASGEPIPGTVMLIMAVIILPPINKLMVDKWKLHFPVGLKIVVIVIGLIIIGLTIDNTTQQDDQSQAHQEQKQLVSSHEQQKEEMKKMDRQVDVEDGEKNDSKETIPILFDIPTLLNKNILYFISEFGEPVNEHPEPSEEALKAGAKTWTKTFTKDGYSINVTYVIDNGKVIKIFLYKGTPDMPIKETWINKDEINGLLERGNIFRDAHGYYYRFWWPIQDKNMYTGVEIQREPLIGSDGKQLCNGYPEC